MFLHNAEKGRNGRMVSTAGIATESTKKAIASFPFKGGGSGLWYFAVSLSPRKPLSQMLRYHKNLLNRGIVGFR